MNDSMQEERYAQYLEYLYTTAHIKYGDCPEIDSLVQDSIVAFFVREQENQEINHPKALLDSILHHKYNDWLRRKYRNRLVSYEYDLPEDIPTEEEDVSALNEEYADVRREIGRLMRIYREVAIRHYVHGQSVDEIAKAMRIPRGTVLSRLSKARNQIKEGLTNMEKYSSVSYEPKDMSVGIWGYCAPHSGEPFSLISSPIEVNALVLAYEHPLSIRGIADAMGVPCAYLEPVVDKLVKGELMGKTASGLVYTRCHLQDIENRYGNIPAQEALASERAAQIAELVNRHTAELFALPAVAEMTDKQKATLWLIVLNEALTIAVQQTRQHSPDDPKEPPERPNGGKWLASCTVFDQDPEKRPVTRKTSARSG
ncbi:MAG: RNA polymerase sigma factor, partial [Clostridia bacterium]|nr:RNA polymerase sigma factor [Clostridia bacterium]